MTNLSMFYQKNGIMIRNIARDLLCLDIGDIMTSIAEYTVRFDVSRWTVQTAIQFLLENKCMSIEKHGPKGTVVCGMDRKRLWEMADFNPMLALVPPPSSVIHDSLYTGLAEAFNRTDFPVNLAYMVPGGLRMKYLNSGRCHFTIVSALAAKLMLPENPDLNVIMDLKDATYSLPFRLYARKGGSLEITDGTRVGYYEAAAEQSYMTDALCQGKQVVKVSKNYHGCVNALAKGEIDVLVKRSDIETSVLAGCPYVELDSTEDYMLATKPVILINRTEYDMDRIVTKYINPSVIAEKQKEVLEGRCLRNYY